MFFRQETAIYCLQLASFIVWSARSAVPSDNCVYLIRFKSGCFAKHISDSLTSLELYNHKSLDFSPVLFHFLSFSFHVIYFCLTYNHGLAEVSKDFLIHYLEGCSALHIHKVIGSKLIKFNDFYSFLVLVLLKMIFLKCVHWFQSFFLLLKTKRSTFLIAGDKSFGSVPLWPLCRTPPKFLWILSMW